MSLSDTLMVNASFSHTLSGVDVEASVTVSEGCSIRGTVCGANGVDFLFQARRQQCSLSFDAEGLRSFLRLGERALANMDHRHTLDEVGEPAPEEDTELEAAWPDAAPGPDAGEEREPGAM
jgi:hypothetical protein